MALLGSLQGALGGKEVAGGVVGLVVGAADLRRNKEMDPEHTTPQSLLSCFIISRPGNKVFTGQDSTLSP